MRPESPSFVVLSLVALLLGSPVVDPPGLQAARTATVDDGPVVERRVVAGGADDFMEVTHLRIEGSSFEIGRALAEIARERHGYALKPSADPRRTRAQRRYFETHHAAHLERMRGVASLFGKSVDEDAYVFSNLLFGFSKPGCSVVFFPPDSTVDGVGGVLSRNFDFTTGTFRGRLPDEDEIPICSTPYVLELVPADGYASL